MKLSAESQGREQTRRQKIEIAGVLAVMGASVVGLAVMAGKAFDSKPPSAEEIAEAQAAFAADYDEEYRTLSLRDQFEVTYVDPPMVAVEGEGIFPALVTEHVPPAGGDDCLTDTPYDTTADNAEDSLRFTMSDSLYSLSVVSDAPNMPELRFTLGTGGYGEMQPADAATTSLLADNHCS